MHRAVYGPYFYPSRFEVVAQNGQRVGKPLWAGTRGMLKGPVIHQRGKFEKECTQQTGHEKREEKGLGGKEEEGDSDIANHQQGRKT